jgi:hypothetical protein
MLIRRLQRETTTTLLSLAAAVCALGSGTHAWLPSGLFGLLVATLIALQPDDDGRFPMPRRVLFTLAFGASLVCLAWAVGARITDWPGLPGVLKQLH